MATAPSPKPQTVLMTPPAAAELIRSVRVRTFMADLRFWVIFRLLYS